MGMWLVLVAPKGLGHYWRSHYGDKTFEHLYRWNWFDTTLLVPYFIVMLILAFYGIHRYQLVWLYYRNKKKEARSAEPPARFAEGALPSVTIQLPIFNEQFVVDRLIDAICRIDYPRDRFQIQVLDDSTDETRDVARAVVEKYAAGFSDLAPQPIHYIHRTNRHGYKAGALDAGLNTATGELVAIFDADFQPPADWVMKVVHHFAEPGIGMVQTRWTHINRDYSFLTQVEAILLDGHFVLEHGGRSRAGVFFNFNGTAGMWRRRVIGEAGGWQHDTLTEDTDLSYRAQLIGWKFKYLQDVECPAELPIEMTAFKTQQARWAKGLIQTGKKILPRVLESDAPWHTKLEAWYHLTANISYPLMIVLSVLLMPAMVIRSWQGYIQMLLIDVPLFLASTMSVSTFYLVSQKELHPKTWWKSIPYIPFVMALGGVGLTISNTKAVMEALFGIQSAFARTPKYSVKKKGEKSQAKVYRKRLGMMPWIELAIGCYFLWTVFYAISTENYFTVPFLLLFVFGYWYTGLLSLLQGRFERGAAPGLGRRYTKSRIRRGSRGVAMHGQVLVWVFFAALLVPVIGMAFCWRAWLGRRYPEAKRRRVVQTGLAIGSLAVVFAAALPAIAMLPLHMQGGFSEMLTGLGMVSGVAACPLAVVLLAFGYGRERWLGIACVLLALAADMAMILGTQG